MWESDPQLGKGPRCPSPARPDGNVPFRLEESPPLLLVEDNGGRGPIKRSLQPKPGASFKPGQVSGQVEMTAVADHVGGVREFKGAKDE